MKTMEHRGLVEDKVVKNLQAALSYKTSSLNSGQFIKSVRGSKFGIHKKKKKNLCLCG